MNHTAAPSGSCSRRTFLAGVVSAAALARLAPARAAQSPDATPAVAPAKEGAAPRCIHVFAKPLHGFSCEETAEIVAEAGFGGIDFAVRRGGHVLPEKVKEDLPRAVAAARKRGLKVEMITTGIVNTSDPRTRDIVETAGELGVKYYRLGFIPYDAQLGVWDSLQRLKPMIQELEQLNRRHGVHGAIQNHAGVRVGGAGWDIFELLRDRDPQWIGCQYDIRHGTVEGGLSWPVTLKLLRPWIRCMDIKDFRWHQVPGKATVEDVPIGEGIVDFDQYFKLVSELGIPGPMSMHFEYPPFERATEALSPAEKRTRFLAAMKKDLNALKTHLTKHAIT